jgi:hypothetical protein
MQHLRDGEEEQPKAQYRGQDAQDEHGGHLLVPAAGMRMVRVALPYGVRAAPLMGCRADANARAKGGHKQECDANNDPDIEHSDDLLRPMLSLPALASSLDAIRSPGTVD